MCETTRCSKLSIARWYVHIFTRFSFSNHFSHLTSQHHVSRCASSTWTILSALLHLSMRCQHAVSVLYVCLSTVSAVIVIQTFATSSTEVLQPKLVHYTLQRPFVTLTEEYNNLTVLYSTPFRVSLVAAPWTVLQGTLLPLSAIPQG